MGPVRVHARQVRGTSVARVFYFVLPSPSSMRYRVFRRHLALTAAGVSTAAWAHADMPAGASRESRAENAETVHVTGTLPPRSASETVRGRDVLSAAPRRTASDALNAVPGIFVTQHSGEGKAHQIFVRGFDAVHGQDLELWVGGVPINEVSNIHGQGYADLHFVMPEVLREIRITPGTYDPRQGDFAVAGTLRMQLGLAEPGATVKGALGSFGSRRLFLGYHPKDASEETFVAGEFYETDGFGPNRAASRASVIGQVTHDFRNGLAARILATTYAGRYDSAGVVPAGAIESGALDRFVTLDPKQGGYSTRSSVATELRHEDDSIRGSFTPFLVFRTLSLRQNFTGASSTDAPGSSGNTEQQNESLTLGSTASMRRGLTLTSPRDAIELGVYGRHDVVRQSQRALSRLDDSASTTAVDADVRGTNVAAYVDASLHPLARVALRGGIRADALSFAVEDRVGPNGTLAAQASRASHGHHLGKKLTLDVAALAHTHVLASYGEGFRSPQARSLSQGENAVFTEVSSYELGIRHASTSRVSGTLAAFYTRLSEDLVFDPAVARNERVPSTARKGLTADALFRPVEGMVVSSSATYAHASFTASGSGYLSGDLVPYAPQLVLRTDASFTRPVGRALGRTLEARIGTGFEGLAGRPLPFGERGRNVFLIDASAGVRLAELELGVDVYNMLDAPWYDGQFVYASNFSPGGIRSQLPQKHVTIGPPRTAFVSLTIHL